MRDRERTRTRGRDTGRGRNRPHAESPMWDSIRGPQDHALGRRQALNYWATQASRVWGLMLELSDHRHVTSHSWKLTARSIPLLFLGGSAEVWAVEGSWPNLSTARDRLSLLGIVFANLQIANVPLFRVGLLYSAALSLKSPQIRVHIFSLWEKKDVCRGV